MQHAVCLTGLERSFEEIGGNVREGVYAMLGPNVTFFGVRPANSTWASVHELLHMHSAPTRGRCWSDAVQAKTINWMHCDFRMRAGDCRLSFLQALCDLAQCEDLISSFEQKERGGTPFDAVLRLRADLFWEMRVDLPPLAPNTVYMPNMDSQSGTNDHLAVGEREAMRKYMTRVRHANRTDAVRKLKTKGSEGYMKASLQWDGVEEKKLQQWMYCPHTPRNLLRGSNREGCIGRVRCRTACVSLWCPPVSIKGGECECLDSTCDDFAANRGDGKNGSTAVIGPDVRAGPNAKPVQLRYHRRPTDRTRRDAHRWCVDLRGRQLFHACPQVRRPVATKYLPPPGTADPAVTPPAANRGGGDGGRKPLGLSSQGGHSGSGAGGAFCPSHLPLAMGGACPKCGGELCLWRSELESRQEVPQCFLHSVGISSNLTTRYRKCGPHGVVAKFVGKNGHWLW